MLAGAATATCTSADPVSPAAQAGIQKRFLIDITAEKSAKQFVRGEWFVGPAVLTSIVYLILFKYLALTVWPATLIAFAVGFIFRVAAIWFAWEEPLPRGVPTNVRGEVEKRESLKEKMQPDWEPKYD